MPASDWRSLIGRTVLEVWPGLNNGAEWIEAQVQAESAGDPNAVSPAGAVGLLQLMPGTAREVGVTDRRDPQQSLSGGVRYLKKQYEALDHVVEFPTDLDHIHWSLAAYNAGRAYIVEALLLAERDGEPGWEHWKNSRYYLFHRSCRVNSRYPDYRQVWKYVERIHREFLKLTLVVTGKEQRI